MALPRILTGYTCVCVVTNVNGHQCRINNVQITASQRIVLAVGRLTTTCTDEQKKETYKTEHKHKKIQILARKDSPA